MEPRLLFSFCALWFRSFPLYYVMTFPTPNFSVSFFCRKKALGRPSFIHAAQKKWCVLSLRNLQEYKIISGEYIPILNKRHCTLNHLRGTPHDKVLSNLRISWGDTNSFTSLVCYNDVRRAKPRSKWALKSRAHTQKHINITDTTLLIIFTLHFTGENTVIVKTLYKPSSELTHKV